MLNAGYLGTGAAVGGVDIKACIIPSDSSFNLRGWALSQVSESSICLPKGGGVFRICLWVHRKFRLHSRQVSLFKKQELCLWEFNSRLFFLFFYLVESNESAFDFYFHIWKEPVSRKNNNQFNKIFVLLLGLGPGRWLDHLVFVFCFFSLVTKWQNS